MVRLTGPLFSWRWAFRLGYIANGDGEVTVRAGRTVTTLPVSSGLHETFWYAEGAMSVLRITTDTPGLVLCTDDVTAGEFVPLAAAP
jgi:hypothetical protein